jgi:hypothetical protein
MILRLSALLPLALACSASAKSAEAPARLDTSDLVIAGVAVDRDTGAVRSILGSPTRTDSNTWYYPDLTIALDSGRVGILSLTGASRATARGLRVGDRFSRVDSLYATCFADSTFAQICYSTDFDPRAVTIQSAGGRIRGINVGRILKP